MNDNSVIIKTPFEDQPYVIIPLEDGENAETIVDDKGGLLVRSVPNGAVVPGEVLIRVASGSWSHVYVGVFKGATKNA